MGVDAGIAAWRKVVDKGVGEGNASTHWCARRADRPMNHNLDMMIIAVGRNDKQPDPQMHFFSARGRTSFPYISSPKDLCNPSVEGTDPFLLRTDFHFCFFKQKRYVRVVPQTRSIILAPLDTF